MNKNNFFLIGILEIKLRLNIGLEVPSESRVAFLSDV